MGEAFLWGAVAGSSLVLGGPIALRFPISRRLLGLIMAFGAGVLISAVAFELVHEAFETSAGDGGVALGLLAGSLVFFGAEVVIDRLGERRETAQGARMPHMREERSCSESSWTESRSRSSLA